ncbi:MULTISPECIES: ATP-binding protein [unclassified Caballeronia]|uniref:sensor histidine kinase n=1 Tax=unclassified Caballeronia TaxID=2646786 RepID=UPI00285C73BB|nr:MULTISPECIES: ATP-binding protein [unclassified Caballeronia]MDR5749256.1 ATP-binding protein [Caballeronia sp. LZ024]MDR5843613.1 ATP-binding protein [Caballeronia sp. LZ031]
MNTSTVAITDRSLAPRAALCAVPPACAPSGSPAVSPDASPSGVPSTRATGEQSAISALIDARLAADREIQRLSARVQQLSAQLVAVDERVRRSLAQDLHDDAGSALTAARFALARIETWLPADAPAPCGEALQTARQSLDAACDATHRVVANSHAPCFDDGVAAALVDWAARFAAVTSLDVHVAYRADDHRLARLPEAIALAVFRVAQEALNNVARHASAGKASVRIAADARFVTLVIEDDGIGIPAAARRKRGRFGLAGMRARCDALGGSLRLSAAKTGGTTVRARFPLMCATSPIAPIRRALHAVESRARLARASN